MSQPHPELLILVVTLVALALAPVASHLVKLVGGQISSELDHGLSGEALQTHLNESYDGAVRDDEIAQMLEAHAFMRGGDAPAVDDALRERVRALADGEDVDPDVVQRLAALLRAGNGHGPH